MSAFFVGTDHINAMLTAAKELKLYTSLPGTENRQSSERFDNHHWTMLGRALIEENCKSLAARYPSDWRELLPDGFKVEDYKFEEDLYFATRHKITDAIHLADCYDYQSCEHDGWEGSWAAKFSNSLARKAAYKVPESGKCWEYNKPADAPKIVSLSSMLAR